MPQRCFRDAQGCFRDARECFRPLGAARRSMEQSETLWGVSQGVSGGTAQHTEALGARLQQLWVPRGCLEEFRAAARSHAEAPREQSGNSARPSPVGQLPGGGKLRGVWSSLAGRVRAFKGFVESSSSRVLREV